MYLLYENLSHLNPTDDNTENTSKHSLLHFVGTDNHHLSLTSAISIGVYSILKYGILFA